MSFEKELCLMRISSSLNHLISAAAASALLVGCGNGGLQPNLASNTTQQSVSGNGNSSAQNGIAISAINPTDRGKIRMPGQPYPTWMRFGNNATTSSVAYVAEFAGTSVLGYHLSNKQNKGPFCTVPASVANFPATDTQGNLWVPNGLLNSNQRATIEYGPNCGAQLLYINDTDGQPSNVAFDSHNNVYVLNITSPSGGCILDVYAPGSTSTSKTLTISAASFCIGIALDRQNNVYVSWDDSSRHGHVAEFAKGSSSYTPLPMSIGFPGTLTFDLNKNLLLVDQTAGVVDVYNPPYGSTPNATITLKGTGPSCNFDHHRTHLYCADHPQGSADVYSYNSANPSATTYKYSWTAGLQGSLEVQSVALDPPAPNK